MTTPDLRASSPLVTAEPGSLTLSVPVPSHVDGDLILVWTWGYANDADLVHVPEIPPGAVEVASLVTALSFHQVFYVKADIDTPSMLSLEMQEATSGWTGFADVFYNVDWEVGPITDSEVAFTLVQPEMDDPMPVAVPLIIDGPNHRAYIAWRGLNASRVHSDDVTGPLGWVSYTDRAIFSSRGAEKVVIRSIEKTEDVVIIPATSAGGYAYSFIGLVFVGPDTPVVPPPETGVAAPLQVQPDLLRLGCAETYNAYITDGTYENIIDVVRWSDLSWERVEDDVSAASATLPDELGGVLCVAKHGGLRPWKYGLLIERNDQRVWNGPITNVARRGDAITVAAGDVFARYRKRFLLRNVAEVSSYTNVDAGKLFYDIIRTHAFQPSDLWTPAVPLVSVASSITRKLRPREFKYAWDMLGELLDTSIDAYVLNGVVYIWEPGAGWRYQGRVKRTLEGPYNANHDLVYGTFTEESFLTRPDWTIDGMSQGNFVAVPDTETGEEAFRTYVAVEDPVSQAEYGVLDYVDSDPTETPEDKTPAEVSAVLNARAGTLLAMRSYPPAVIEGGVLSENAPVSIDHLRPGSMWRLDVFDVGYGQLLQVGRVKRIAVSVSARDGEITETITPTLYPPGWQGEV